MSIKAIVVYNRSTHVSRVLTGLRMLEDNGLVNITFIENINNKFKLPSGHIVEVCVEGKRIAFDMGDRWALYNEPGKKYLDQVDYYCVRSYSSKIDIVTPEIFADNPKVQPYGLYYYVTYPNNPLDKRSGIKNKTKDAIKHLTGYYKLYYPSAFELSADKIEKEPKIIFMTRLWGTKEFEDVLKKDISPEARNYIIYMCEERDRINRQRIEIMRALKGKYGSTFIGGMSNDETAQTLCPDLIVPDKETAKKIYMSKVKSAEICIGTMGLHRSIGGKVGEYVAASKAIVTDKLEYEVPGNFEEGKNYLSFSTVDECLKEVDFLYNNPQLIKSMKKANEHYYQDYVNPEKQVFNAFKGAGVNL